jgi:hypothetical protein
VDRLPDGLIEGAFVDGVFDGEVLSIRLGGKVFYPAPHF